MFKLGKVISFQLKNIYVLLSFIKNLKLTISKVKLEQFYLRVCV